MQTFLLFCTKKLLFLFYTPIFTKHLHQFIYSTHLFNKIFILFTIFYYSLPHRLSLTNPIQNPSLHHCLSLSQTQSASLSLSHQPNNNYNPPVAAAQFRNLSLALLWILAVFESFSTTSKHETKGYGKHWTWAQAQRRRGSPNQWGRGQGHRSLSCSDH